MCDFAQELGSMSFLLQGIAVIRRTNNGYFISDYFPVLSLALRGDQRSSHRYGSARDQSLHCRIVRQSAPGNDLQIPQAGAVVKFDKRKILGVSTRSHPALHQYRREWRGSIQCVFDRSRRQHGGKVDEAMDTLKRVPLSSLPLRETHAQAAVRPQEWVMGED